MVKTTLQLEELAEKERCAGNRQRFLEIKKQIEIKEQEEVLAQHKLHLETVSKEFFAGLYIPELHARVKEIKDGCGTKQGWVDIYLSGIERPLKYWELKKKIREAQEKISVRDYFAKLKFSDKAKALCIGDNDSDTLEALIKVMEIDLPTVEEVDEYNLDYCCEVMSAAKEQAIKDGYTDEEAEEKALEAEGEEMNRIYKEYSSAVLKTLNYLFEFHELELTQLNKHYWLVAKKSWKEAADKVAITITGYGMFEYNSGKELRDIGPYKNYCEAIIKHLHWLRYYPDIYGVTGYRRIYER